MDHFTELGIYSVNSGASVGRGFKSRRARYFKDILDDVAKQTGRTDECLLVNC